MPVEQAKPEASTTPTHTPEPAAADTRKPKALTPLGTVIAADTKVSGNISTEASMTVAGDVEGNLNAKGPVHIVSSAQVHGDVEASDVMVHGKIKGNVTVTGKLTIAATGSVFGDIKVRSLLVEDGGILQGRCQMSDLNSTPKLASAPEADLDTKEDREPLTQVLPEYAGASAS